MVDRSSPLDCGFDAQVGDDDVEVAQPVELGLVAALPGSPRREGGGQRVGGGGEGGEVGVGSCHVVRGVGEGALEVEPLLSMEAATDDAQVVEGGGRAVVASDGIGAATLAFSDAALDLAQLDIRIVGHAAEAVDDATPLGFEHVDRREPVAGVVDRELLRGRPAPDACGWFAFVDRIVPRDSAV